MIQKPFDAITKADIDSLISNQQAESTTLEYKQQLPGSQEKDKKEFLADVSALANARGGDIVYGIKCGATDGRSKGCPTEVLPLIEDDPDNVKLRLEQIIRDGIDPRVTVQIKAIEGWGPDGRGHIILIRVPKSFNAPHMVTYDNVSRFFSRNSAGKYQLDVTQIRSAVLATESQADRIKRFREDRIAKIFADDPPVKLRSPYRLVVHIVPLTTFLNRERLNLAAAQDRLYHHFRESGSTFRFNLDGFLVANEDLSSREYCHMYFEGAFEAVHSDFVQFPDNAGAVLKKGCIGSGHYERWVVKHVSKCMEAYRQLDVNGPFAVGLSLIGCKGVRLYVDWKRNLGNGHPIDRDVAILHEIVLENNTIDVSKELRPVFDQVWNACGFERSFNYDETGKWDPR